MTKPTLPGAVVSGDDATHTWFQNAGFYLEYWNEERPARQLRYTGVKGGGYQTIATGTVTGVGFDDVADIGELINEWHVKENFVYGPTQGAITAPVAGIYRAMSTVCLTGNASGRVASGFRLNGGGVQYYAAQRNEATTPQFIWGQRYIELDTSDEVQFIVEQDSGSSLEFRSSSRIGLRLISSKT
jgi:hypothetical protein